MSAKVTDGYMPPEHFTRAEGLPPVAPEAIDENSELWLIRLPANEIGQVDLLEKNLNLKLNASNGKMGHFVSQKGQEYNVIKHRSVDMLQPYAIIPNGSGPLVVRKIACQVGFVRSLSVTAVEENSHQVKKDKPDVYAEHTHRSGPVQENYITPMKQTTSVSDVVQRGSKKKQTSSVSEVFQTPSKKEQTSSVSEVFQTPSRKENASSVSDVVEKPSKKKRRRSELSDRN